MSDRLFREPATPDRAFDAATNTDRRGHARRMAWRRHPLLMIARRFHLHRPEPPARASTLSRAELLCRLRELPNGEWSYGWENTHVRHLGPMAQDFWDTFGLGSSDRRIDLGDAIGVCMATICALADRVDELDARLAPEPAGERSANGTS